MGIETKRTEWNGNRTKLEKNGMREEHNTMRNRINPLAY
jgi:hypothetical protein